MDHLRQASFLARCVLAWFLLSLGAAIAAPVVQPERLELICGGGAGMKLLPQSGEDGSAKTLDCPLCSAVGPAPVQACVPAVAAVPDLAVLAPLRGASFQPPVLPPARGPPAAGAR
jgi:hypothetical protein